MSQAPLQLRSEKQEDCYRSFLWARGHRVRVLLLFIFYLSILLETFTMSCKFLVIKIVFNFGIFCNLKKKMAKKGQWKGMCPGARKT